VSQLSNFNKSRIRYHLGYYIVSVPAGDYARLEEAMNSVPDAVFADKLVYQIGRCDSAERKTQLASFEDDFQPPSTRVEGIVGDVDRTIRSFVRDKSSCTNSVCTKLQRSIPGTLSI
jgi:hypothetical protein